MLKIPGMALQQLVSRKPQLDWRDDVKNKSVKVKTQHMKTPKPWSLRGEKCYLHTSLFLTTPYSPLCIKATHCFGVTGFRGY